MVVPCLFQQLSLNRTNAFNYSYDGYVSSYSENFYLGNLTSSQTSRVISRSTQ